MTQALSCFPLQPSATEGGGLPPQLVISRSWWPDVLFLLFIIIFKKSQPASGVMEVVGLAEMRLGVAELKLKLVSWLAMAFCGAQRCVMPASYVQFDKPWCWDRAGYRHHLDVNSCCAGYCWFSPGAGKQGGRFHLPWGTRCCLFNTDIPTAPVPCPPLARAHGSRPEVRPSGPDCLWLH